MTTKKKIIRFYSEYEPPYDRADVINSFGDFGVHCEFSLMLTKPRLWAKVGFQAFGFGLSTTINLSVRRQYINIEAQGLSATAQVTLKRSAAGSFQEEFEEIILD